MKIRFKIFSAFIAGITALTSITGGVYHAADNTFMNVSAADENVRGDANGDGRLNVRDAACIARMMSRGSTDQLPKAADFNGDGKVNVRDAAAIANTMSMKTCLTDTVFYDVNDDGKDDMIELYKKDDEWGQHITHTTLRVYYTDGPLEDYESCPMPNQGQDFYYYIVYDNNIDMKYIAFTSTRFGTNEYTFYIHNVTNKVIDIGVSGNASHSYTDWNTLEYEYTINGETASKEEFLNYMRNIEVIYPHGDNLIESGIKMVETNWN